MPPSSRIRSCTHLFALCIPFYIPSIYSGSNPIVASSYTFLSTQAHMSQYFFQLYQVERHLARFIPNYSSRTRTLSFPSVGPCSLQFKHVLGLFNLRIVFSNISVHWFSFGAAIRSPLPFCSSCFFHHNALNIYFPHQFFSLPLYRLLLPHHLITSRFSFPFLSLGYPVLRSNDLSL